MERHLDPSARQQNNLQPANLRLQCLRILRCTAEALASSPGGFCFRPGTRPWLDGLAAIGQGHAPAAMAGPVNQTLRPH